MNKVFAPGCALILYKPQIVSRLQEFLEKKFGDLPQHLICCHHEPHLSKGTTIINVCSGCDKRFRSLYEGLTVLSLWEVLLEDDTFPFPDYGGRVMSIHDACPIRTEARVHNAVRKLLQKMNIVLVEPAQTRSESVCCGDSYYPNAPIDEIRGRMRSRAQSMPCDDVVVYCVSCIKSMDIGGKKPHYLLDLLFGEDTIPGETNTKIWHEQLERFIEAH